MYCGERGIRTPGGVTLNGFQDRRIRPLCHFSSEQNTVLIRVQRYNFFFILQRKNDFFSIFSSKNFLRSVFQLVIDFL